MGHRGFVLIKGRLRNSKEAAEFLNTIKDYAYSIRHYRWVYFPMFRIRKSNGYEVEVIHVGCCSRRQRKRLTTLEARLKKRFKNVSLKHLSIEKLRAI